MLPYDLLSQLPHASPTDIAGHHAAIDVWWWAYAADRVNWDHIKSALTREEQDRAESFRFNRDAIGFIAGRHLQRSILSVYLELSPEGLSIVSGEYGKPYVANSTLTFNLSNTDGLAVLAVSRGCWLLGVDAENISRVLEPETAGIFCSAREQETLSALQGAERQALLLTYWTLKESFVKATGYGLNVEPHRLNVRFDPDAKAISIDYDLANGNANWHHRLLRSPTGHLIAISAQSNRAELPLRQCSLPDPI